ncbi:glycoside hydrolase family 114 protein [Zopfia rhizophila CBS 207.26]|uniref:alpha-galactosidase n=1 Tax=Zopfia rhizophila CBS 207.26 TaxID=1314779 RepID=A0A6A6DDZ5_9PEZI|nr:glycoside hydrolase family 114 protein [Zopfia rhizophila CBS 207.26]
MADKSAPPRSSWSLRRKIILGVLVAIIVIGLALGLGLGLTIGRKGDDDDDSGSETTPTGAPLPTPTGTLPWTPKVKDTWQIILLNRIELDQNATAVSPDVSIYDIDLFNTPKTTIDTLHRLGKKVICYFSGGSYEPNRPDSDQFKEEDMGKDLEGWPGERWLRLGSENVRRIMKGRVEEASRKGCDGVDPDNVDGYQNENGLNLTADDSISFMSYLSSLTTPLNLSLGLKNAGDIIRQVLPIVHFSVNEECVKESECERFHAFINAGKPVFHIEYPDGAGSDLKLSMINHYCDDSGDAKGSEDFSTVLKKMDLDGWVQYCDRSIAITETINTKSER